jgi:uncharacterized protein DUF882
MRGQAADISLKGRTLSQLHMAALSLRSGGVGYYPAHDFIHVDVGPIRTWGGGSSYFASTPSAPAPSSTESVARTSKHGPAHSQVVVLRGGQHPSASTGSGSNTVALRPGTFLVP